MADLLLSQSFTDMQYVYSATTMRKSEPKAIKNKKLKGLLLKLIHKLTERSINLLILT